MSLFCRVYAECFAALLPVYSYKGMTFLLCAVMSARVSDVCISVLLASFTFVIYLRYIQILLGSLSRFHFFFSFYYGDAPTDSVAKCFICCFLLVLM